MFNWNEDYALGIKEIDDQHKHLFSIGNELYELLNTAAEGDIYDEIMAIVDSLTDYTIFHFSVEEKYFETFNYEGAADHIKEHQAFIQKLESIDFHAVDEDQRKHAMGILKIVIDWIFKHIHGSDFLYKDCFNSHMGL